jgi:hypothetical protein
MTYNLFLAWWMFWWGPWWPVLTIHHDALIATDSNVLPFRRRA